MLPAPTRTRLEKAAVDNGFDRELPPESNWLGYASTQAPLRIWLTGLGEGLFLLAVSQQNVARALVDHGTAFSNPLPQGAVAARGLLDIPALNRAVRRAFQLSRSLPDEILHSFEQATARLGRSTEAERLVVQRVGQDLFRAGLLDYWDGRCAVTGFAVRELLRASHIKPWAYCQLDSERLDVFNGLLLSPNLDAAFDCGFITFEDDGRLLISPSLPATDQLLLGLSESMRIQRLTDAHRAYLPWHRANLFRKA